MPTQTLKLALPTALLLTTIVLTPPPAASAQDSDSVRTVVEEMPTLLPDNSTAFAAMTQEMTYPESAKEAGAEGRVLVQFVVDEEGDVADPEVTRGVHEALDAEALRVVETLRFRPGRQDGEPVKVEMTMPFTFRLPADTTGTPADTTSGSQGGR